MNWKISATPAIVISFAGIIAMKGDLIGYTAAVPPPVGLPDTTLQVDSLPFWSPWNAAWTRPRRLAPLPPDHIDSETLWLARCIYSETKRPEEQELVGWVVRNRVETGYRGRHTYRDVVLDPFQFSAFAPNNPKRKYYMSLDVHDKAPGWQRALRIAYYVRHVDSTWRPFSVRTRHFFSERSLSDSTFPAWSVGLVPVQPRHAFKVVSRRFRFYEDVA